MAWTVTLIKPGTAYMNYTCRVVHVAKFRMTGTVNISPDRKTYTLVYVDDPAAPAGTDTWTMPIVYIPGPPVRTLKVVQAVVGSTKKGGHDVPTVEDGTTGGRPVAKSAARKK